MIHKGLIKEIEAYIVQGAVIILSTLNSTVKKAMVNS